MEPALVLYDGDCGFCSRAVRFVFRRDPAGRFRFASLQGEVGRRALAEHGLPVDALDTVVLVDGGRVFLRSTAALRIARGLRGPWKLAYGFIAVPRPWRDWAYDAFARRRHAFFRNEACALPTPELRARMLD